MQEKKKGRIQRWIGSYLTAVMVFTSVFSQPFVMSSLAAGEDTDARASASDAVKNSRIQVKNQEKEDIQITVLSDNAGYEPGETVCLELYITNNTDQPVEEGVLSYSGKGILEDSAYFEDLSDLYGITEESPKSQEEAQDEEAQDKEVQDEEVQDEEAPAPDMNEEAGQEGSGISGEGSNPEEGNAPEEKAEGQLKERAAADEEEIPNQNPAGQERIDEADADFDEEMDEGEDGDSEEDQKRLTDLTIEPGQSYYVNFYYTIDEEIQGAKSQKIDFSFKGKKEDKRISVKETFRYAIGALNLLPVGFYSEGYEDGQIPAGKEGGIYLTFDLGELKEILEETRTEEEANKEEAGKGEAASSSDGETASPSNGKKASSSNAWVKWEDEESGAPVKKDEKPLISKLSCQVEAYGVHLENFQTLDLESSEDDMRVTGKFRIAEDTEPGIYFGKAAASYKYRGKNFQTSQGFMVKVLEQEEEEEAGPIQLTGRLEGQDIEVTVTGPRESFPETEELEVRVSELSQEQQEQVARALEKKAEEEGVEIPYYKALDITLYAHGEEIEPIGPVEVSFKNLKLEKQEEKDPQNADAGIALLSAEGEEKTEAYSIAELQEMEMGDTIKVYHLEEEVNDTVKEMESTTDESGAVVMETDHFSVYIAAIRMPTGTEGEYVDIHSFKGETVDGVKVTMFNYSGGQEGSGSTDINTEGLGPYGFKFFANSDTVDGAGNSTGRVDPEMDLNLSKTGYPQVTNYDGAEDKTMAYLFSGDVQKGNTMEDGGGLFQRDKEGYYYYDSAENAAYYDEENGEFKLYDCVIRPYYIGTTNKIERSNFLPFNPIENAGVVIDKNFTPPAGKLANKAVDLWFGMMVEFEFFMPKGGMVGESPMKFEFSGDDDVFVYIDNKLVLDLGTTHEAWTGTIDFHTGTVSGRRQQDKLSSLKEIFNLQGDTFKDYTKHTLKFFYMERGGYISYCKLKFNLPPVPEGSLTVTKSLEADDAASGPVKEFIEDTLSYKFRVIKENAKNKATISADDLFVKPGTSYRILKNGAVTAQTGTVDDKGYFELKAGQSAQFQNMLQVGGNDESSQYVVEECLPDQLNGQYSGVQYQISSEAGFVKTNDGPKSEFHSYQTGDLSASETQMVTFCNKVNVSKLGLLKITKEQGPDSAFSPQKEFSIQVKLGGEPLAVGTEYKVENASGGTRTERVSEAGILKLKVGETATIIKGILSGTTYEVTEDGANGDEFKTVYSGSVETAGEGTQEVSSQDPSKISGEFPLGKTVQIRVTNSNYFTGEIPISKECKGNNGTASFNFKIEEVEQQNGEWKVKEGQMPLPGTTITVSGEEKKPGTITVGYNKNFSGTKHYKVSEDVDGNGFIYDTTFYIVELQVTPGAGGNGTAELKTVLRNGTELIENKDVLPFINWKTTQLKVTKTIGGTANPPTDESFPFTLIAKDKKTGETIRLQKSQDRTDYSITDDGCASFTLKHGGEISIPVPVGADVTITEKDHPGYIVSAQYQIDGQMKTVQGDTHTINGTDVIEFINLLGGAVLPDTGGPGVGLIKEYGWMLLLLALMMAGMEVQYYGSQRRKRKVEV